MRRCWKQAGVSPQSEVITDCRSGRRASYAYPILRRLGFDTVKIRHGAMLERERRQAPLR